MKPSAMHLGYSRSGLRVTVRLNGTVVSQRVLWAPPVGRLLTAALVATLFAWGFRGLAQDQVVLFGFWGPLASQFAITLLAPAAAALASAALLWPRVQQLGGDGLEAVPGVPGDALATVRWAPGRPAELIDHADGDRVVVFTKDSHWSWQHADVQVDVEPQHREYARRLADDPLGDVSLVVVAMALWVGVAQAGKFWQTHVAVQASNGDQYEMSPELIARLLERDLEGEQRGIEAQADRPEHDRTSKGVYLPAGNDGTLARANGGENQGPEVIRTPPPEDELDDLPTADRPEEGEDALALQLTDDVPELEAPSAPVPDSSLPQDEAAEAERLATRPQDPMERFIGWGLRDWLDAGQQDKKLDPQVERQLQAARTRLELNPDDIGALQVVGHYAYLAERVDLCQGAYNRLVELVPDDPAVYNNLALTYKRQGEFQQEEALYRKAVELDPFDPIVLNNLAVNLAHQARFDEALDIMQLLDELMPGDAYTELHRAKIYAAMGKRQKAYKHLERALEGVDQLETLHHIEFRQDLRLEPLFAELRHEDRFRRLIEKRYGDDAQPILQGGGHG
ncbi:MAG: tetratricopeptide repeat protein [Alphaproteobacteria bacterium]|nr:tetratricopeptide repeat protein [Alphaproteobacteria bacterium]